jgi:hypothetical protein
MQNSEENQNVTDSQLKSKKELSKIKSIQMNYDFQEYCNQINSDLRSLQLQQVNNHFDGNTDGFDIPISIPIIPKLLTRGKLSLYEFIILLIILAFNKQGKYFDERNQYFVELLGISITEVEKVISRLLRKKYIFYIDKNGKKTTEKPYDTKSIFELKQKFQSSEKLIEFLNSDRCHNGVNIKRELIISIDIKGTRHYKGFHSFYGNAEESKEMKKYIKKVEEDEKIEYEHLLTEIRNIGFDINDILSFLKLEKRDPSSINWIKISTLLSGNKIDYDSFIEYLKSNKKFKAYFVKLNTL